MVMQQKYTSADTSISVVNKVYTQYTYKPNSIILDYGGGKYDKNIEYMKQKNGSRVLVYDPYNRTHEHNERVLTTCKMLQRPLDYIVCSNVLNVIDSQHIIEAVLKHIGQLMGPSTIVLITIYEGDKSGIGKVTKKGYQRNQPTKDYVDLCKCYFNKVVLKKGIIMCSLDNTVIM